MNLILRTTALLAFSNAISLQTESRMSDYVMDQADWLSIHSTNTESFLAGGEHQIGMYTDMYEGFQGEDWPGMLKVKWDDLVPMFKAVGAFSDFLNGNPFKKFTVDEDSVNKLIKAFESSITSLKKEDGDPEDDLWVLF